MHYSNDSRLRIARDGCHVYPPFLFRPGAPSAYRRRYLRYRSSIPRHRDRFTDVATGRCIGGNYQPYFTPTQF